MRAIRTSSCGEEMSGIWSLGSRLGAGKLKVPAKAEDAKSPKAQKPKSSDKRRTATQRKSKNLLLKPQILAFQLQKTNSLEVQLGTSQNPTQKAGGKMLKGKCGF